MDYSMFDFKPLYAYEGKDPNLMETPSCWNCFERPERLLRCSRCELGYYCSRDCQLEHKEDHMEWCKELNRIKKKVARLAEPLKKHSEWGGPERNLFETSVGHFWGLLTPRDYCRAKASLAEEIRFAAHTYEYKYMYEAALAHEMELMRLSASDNQGIRQTTPFTLLSLNRDQDCYDFLKWWMTTELWGEEVTVEEGEWRYFKGEDIYEDIMECKIMQEALSSLLALSIIKLRIAAHYDSIKSQWEAFKPAADRIQDCNVITNIEQFRHGCSFKELADKMAPQEALAIKYLTLVNDKNKIILPALLNPRPLRSMPAPYSYSPGSAEEAWFVLDTCCRHVARTPNAHKIIKKLLGGKIDYDPKFSTY